MLASCAMHSEQPPLIFSMRTVSYARSPWADAATHQGVNQALFPLLPNCWSWKQ